MVNVESAFNDKGVDNGERERIRGGENRIRRRLTLNMVSTMMIPEFHIEWISIGVNRLRVFAYDKPKIKPEITKKKHHPHPHPIYYHDTSQNNYLYMRFRIKK